MLFRIIFSFRVIGNNIAACLIVETGHRRQSAHAQQRPYRSAGSGLYRSRSYYFHMDFVVRTGKIHLFFYLLCITGDADFFVSIIQRVISDNPFATYTVFITELGSCQTLPVADLRMIGIAHCHNPVVSYRQLQLCDSCFYISFAYRMRRQQRTVTIKNIHVHFMNLILKDLGCTVAYITELQQAVARTVTHIFFDAPVERS